MRKCLGITFERSTIAESTKDGQTLEVIQIIGKTFCSANVFHERIPHGHTSRRLVTRQRGVRHGITGRSLRGHGDIFHPFPLRPHPNLMKCIHRYELQLEFALAFFKPEVVVLLIVHG